MNSAKTSFRGTVMESVLKVMTEALRSGGGKGRDVAGQTTELGAA